MDSKNYFDKVSDKWDDLRKSFLGIVPFWFFFS